MILTEFMLKRVHTIRGSEKLLKAARIDHIESIEATEDKNTCIINMMSGDSFEVVGNYDNIRETVADDLQLRLREAR